MQAGKVKAYLFSSSSSITVVNFSPVLMLYRYFTYLPNATYKGRSTIILIFVTNFTAHRSDLS